MNKNQILVDGVEKMNLYFRNVKVPNHPCFQDFLCHTVKNYTALTELGGKIEKDHFNEFQMPPWRFLISLN